MEHGFGMHKLVGPFNTGILLVLKPKASAGQVAPENSQPSKVGKDRKVENHRS